VRLAAGVYAEAAVARHCRATPRAWHALQTAATLVGAGTTKVAAVASAAAVLRLETLHDPPRRITTLMSKDGGTTTHGTRCGPGRTLVSRLPTEHVGQVFGLRATLPAWTALDLSPAHQLEGAVVALDSAARQFGCRLSELEDAAALQRGWPRSTRTARALALADERSESVLESLGRLSLRHTQLPKPVCQAWIGVVFPEWRVDLLIPEVRVVGEADGRVKYTQPDQLWAEKKRQESIEDMGFAVVRYDHDEARHHPLRLADRFVAAAARSAYGLGRQFADPAWWLAERALAQSRALLGDPWWLTGLCTD
jgi:very-short-patch-repair endonuclease